MDPNVGGLDRRLRVVAALALLVVGYRRPDSTAGACSVPAGSDLLATAVVQCCPVDAMLGVETCSRS